MFAQLFEISPENINLLDNFFNYCVKHHRLEALQKQILSLEQASQPEILEYLPVLRAFAFFLQNDHEQLIPLLSDLQTDNPELLYHAAYMLASIDQTAGAVRLYRRIPSEHPKHALSQLNLSELLSVAGEHSEALELAKKVWQSLPSWPAARECYGLRLQEMGNAEGAIEILDPLLIARDCSERVRSAWHQAMLQNLKKQFDAKEFELAQRSIRRILLYWDNDSVATAYLKRIQEALSEQEKAEDAAANP